MTDPSAETRPAVESAPPAAAATARTSERSRNTPLRIVLTLIVLGALGAAAYGGWRWFQERAQLTQRVAAQDAQLSRLDAQIAALESQGVEFGTRLADQSRLGDRNGTDIAALQARIDDTLALMSRISEDLSGGRTRFQLAAIEHLLVLANDRLQLERDVAAAIAALEAADARLAELSDPQLYPVREALAQERTALRAVAIPDLASASLTLASLIERVPQLPLASHAPAQFHSPDARSADAGTDVEGLGGWQRLLAAVKTAAGTLFTIRREDNARALRLLPPESEAVVYQVLTLKLEGARVALLTGNTVALREEARSASTWLDEQFKANDPGVLAMRGELDRLQGLELRPPLPDISRSLAALRARLGDTP